MTEALNNWQSYPGQTMVTFILPRISKKPVASTLAIGWLVIGLLWFQLESFRIDSRQLELPEFGHSRVFQEESYSETHEGFNKLAVM